MQRSIEDDAIIGFHRRLRPFRAKRMDWRHYPVLVERKNACSGTCSITGDCRDTATEYNAEQRAIAVWVYRPGYVISLVNPSPVRIAEVFREPIKLNRVGIITAHNHPSG